MLLQLMLFYIVYETNEVRAIGSNLEHSQQTRSSRRVKQKFVSHYLPYQEFSYPDSLTDEKNKKRKNFFNTNLANSYEGLKRNYYIHWKKWKKVYRIKCFCSRIQHSRATIDNSSQYATYDSRGIHSEYSIIQFVFFT